MKKIMFGASLALVLASCSGNVTSPLPEGSMTLGGKVYLADLTTLPVKAYPWASGQKTIELAAVTGYTPLTTKTISTGTISTAGELNINLPNTDVVGMSIESFGAMLPFNSGIQPAHQMTCTSSVESVDSGVRVVEGMLKSASTIVRGVKDDFAKDDIFQSDKSGSALLIYADGATQWKDSVTCKTNYQGELVITLEMKIDAEIKKGWNVLYSEVVASTGQEPVTLKISNLSGAPKSWIVLGAP